MSKYNCDLCNYTTDIIGNYNRHINSIKHINNNNKYTISCKCGQTFQHKSSLSRHKKTCQQNYNNSITDLISENPENNIVIKELVSMLRDSIKQNNEQQNYTINTLSDIIKDQNSNLNHAITQIGSSSGNNNIKYKNCENVKINSENKYITFQFYLDNVCCNAPTFTDFLIENVKPLINKEPYCVSQIAKVCAEKLKETKDINRPLQALDGNLFMKLKDIESEEIQWNETDKNKVDDKLARLSNDIVKEEHNRFVEDHPNWNDNDILSNKYMKFVKYYPGHDDPNSFSSEKEFQNIVKNSTVNKKQHAIQ